MIKIGSSSLHHPETGGLDYTKIDVLVREICDLKTRRVDVKNLVHFLIKYRYVENWEREVEENYLPVSQDKLANILTSAGYKFSHKESSKLDFYAKTWDKDFKLRIPDNDGYREIFSRWLITLSTHIKWLLECR